MKITAEEKQMYNVMKALYESGIPISFKGSMVLKACLMEAGYEEETRHTVDIDANWNSASPLTAAQMEGSLQGALSAAGIPLNVHLFRMYGEGRSAGLELTDPSGEILFTMDVDVNRPEAQTKIYEVEGIRFRGASPIQMTADKVAAVSTDKVFRRIKDVVDLYYLSRVFDFDRAAVLQALHGSERQTGTFDGFLHNPAELKYSYEKFRFAGGVNKPPFEEVYQAVKTYLHSVLPQ